MSRPKDLIHYRGVANEVLADLYPVLTEAAHREKDELSVQEYRRLQHAGIIVLSQAEQIIADEQVRQLYMNIETFESRSTE